MADTMQFDLVSPERNLVSIAVREVRLPGSDGDLTAMLPILGLYARFDPARLVARVPNGGFEILHSHGASRVTDLHFFSGKVYGG